MRDFVDGTAFNNEQGNRARKLFAAVVLAALDDAIAALIAEAHTGAGGHAVAPASAAKPSVNLFTLYSMETVVGLAPRTGHDALQPGTRAARSAAGTKRFMTPPLRLRRAI